MKGMWKQDILALLKLHKKNFFGIKIFEDADEAINMIAEKSEMSDLVKSA